jgi:hypothetical protein
MRRAVANAALFVTALLVRLAHASDPQTALDELKVGYALKLQGNCREALPHLTRSLELDAKPKAALNLADCEQQLGDLVAAQGHAAQGRQLAQQQNDAELTGVADEQLAAINERLPRLTVGLMPDAPAGSAVSRDGVLVDATSLGMPVGVNPGAHMVVVTAPGHAERRYDVTIAEGGREQISVEPGAPLAAERPKAQPAQPARDKSRTSEFLVYGAIGVGGIGLTVGIATGLAAGSKHSALQQECQSNGDCPLSAQGDLDTFHSLRTWSTIAYGVGAAGLIGGAALWLWLPRGQSTGPAAGLWFGPTSARLTGSF